MFNIKSADYPFNLLKTMHTLLRRKSMYDLIFCNKNCIFQKNGHCFKENTLTSSISAAANKECIFFTKKH